MILPFLATLWLLVHPPPADPTRRVHDFAGLLNRRQVAEEPYERVAQDYHAALSGIRGAIARWCSAQLSADGQDAAPR